MPVITEKDAVIREFTTSFESTSWDESEFERVFLDQRLEVIITHDTNAQFGSLGGKKFDFNYSNTVF